MKAPSKRVIVTWINDAWNHISADQIKKSFQVCGLNLPEDGSEDTKIQCMKEGSTCAPALEILQMRRLEGAVASLTLDEDDLEEEEKNEIVVYDSDIEDDGDGLDEEASSYSESDMADDTI